ncbi:carbohydrate porin [Frateuria aurantia]
MNVKTRFRPSYLALAMLLGMGSAAHAAGTGIQEDDSQDVSNSSYFDTAPYLLGNWGGERTRLEQKGISFQFGWVNEAANNFTGGDRRTARNTGQLTFGSTIDLDKLWGWKGGTFQITITDRYGRNLNADAATGADQLVQEVYGRGQTWWLTQFWLEQAFFDGRLSIRLGRLPTGSDYGYGDCDFQNLTFCGSQAGNIVGSYWMNWPVSQWAARIKLKTTDKTYVQFAAYQVNPKYTDESWERHYAWRLNNPSGTQGALMPLEFGWTPTPNGLPGLYKLGIYYSNAGGSDLYLNQNYQPIAIDGGTALHRKGSYGGYLSFKQQITGTAGGEGTTLFMNIAKADRNTAQTDAQYSLGVQYKGIFDRPNDAVGFAVGATHNSSYYASYARLYNATHPGTHLIAGGGYEKVAELYYQWSPVAAIQIRPNLQYVADPGGSNENKNVFLFGLKTVVNF